MSQIKIYGLRVHLDPIKAPLSQAIHDCVVQAFDYPADKRAHRFFPLEREDFYYPAGRSERYLILEISLFEGRSVEAKKQLYRLLFERLESDFGIAPIDVEITLGETPRHNWGIRGRPGDELELDYRVEV